jgi:hypothetical protein
MCTPKMFNANPNLGSTLLRQLPLLPHITRDMAITSLDPVQQRLCDVRLEQQMFWYTQVHLAEACGILDGALWVKESQGQQSPGIPHSLAYAHPVHNIVPCTVARHSALSLNQLTPGSLFLIVPICKQCAGPLASSWQIASSSLPG